MMRGSSTAGRQDETDDVKYLSWKIWTENDMTVIALLGSKQVISAHNDSQRL